MNAPQLQAVVFDLDGLMFNTEQLYVEVGDRVLQRYGKRMDQELLSRMMGRPSRDALQMMIDYHQLDSTVAELETISDRIFSQILDTRLAPMPGLLELLDDLEEAGIPKAVATSSRRDFAISVLSRFQFQRRFRFVVTCEDVVHGKPDPEIYLLAATRLGLPAAATMALEDSENGCRAAVAAGAYVVAVPGQHSRDHCFDGARLVAQGLADPGIRQALGVWR